MKIHCKDWYWSLSASILATCCTKPTHWKRPWCWERLQAGGEEEDWGWGGWTASPTRWTWVWASSRRRWKTGKCGTVQSVARKELAATEQLNSTVNTGFPAGSVAENLPEYAGDVGSIPGSGRSPGGGHGNPLQHSCLENPMDRGGW